MRQSSQRERKQINEANEYSKKYQACQHDGNHDPDGGDGRPAPHIAIGVEGGEADPYDHADQQQYAKHHWEDDLREALFAVFDIGMMLGRRTDAKHVEGVWQFGFH